MTDITAPYQPAIKGDFVLPPAGGHPAVCYIMAMLGTQEFSYEGEASKKQAIMFSFELLGDEMMKDGRPFSINTRIMPFSSHEKSNLRKMVQSWRGQPYTEQQLMEMGGLPVSKLIGQPAYVNVVHNSSANKPDRVYANIFSVMKLPKGIPAPKPVNDPVVYSAAHHDQAAFNKLPEYIQAKVVMSPEYQAHMARLKPVDPSHPDARRNSENPDPFADEIPF